MIMKMLIIICLIMQLGISQEPDIQVIDEKPIVSPDAFSELGSIIAPTPTPGTWEDELLWRSNIAAWLNWSMNNSTNISMIA